MTDWKKSELFQAVSDCDRLLLLSQSQNDQERRDHHKDARRLQRGSERRVAIANLRRRLEAIYKAQYGGDPWANVPY